MTWYRQDERGRFAPVPAEALTGQSCPIRLSVFLAPSARVKVTRWDPMLGDTPDYASAPVSYFGREYAPPQCDPFGRWQVPAEHTAARVERIWQPGRKSRTGILRRFRRPGVWVKRALRAGEYRARWVTKAERTDGRALDCLCCDLRRYGMKAAELRKKHPETGEWLNIAPAFADDDALAAWRWRRTSARHPLRAARFVAVLDREAWAAAGRMRFASVERKLARRSIERLPGTGAPTQWAFSAPRKTCPLDCWCRKEMPAGWEPVVQYAAVQQGSYLGEGEWRRYITVWSSARIVRVRRPIIARVCPRTFTRKDR